MPVSYSFDNVYTGERPTLDTIDKLLCEATGYPYSAKNYCPRYDLLTEAGISCLMWAGRQDRYNQTWRITREMWRAFCEHMQADYDADFPTCWVDQGYEYLAGDTYQFSAWR